MQPQTSEVTHHPEAPLLTGDFLANVFNVGFRWKQLLILVRTISLGLYLEQPLPLTVHFAIESGLELLWLPDAK